MSKISIKTVAAALASSHGLTKVQAESFTKDLFRNIAETVLDDKAEISVNDFGTFKLKENGARVGRNPKTGAPVDIAASATVGFKASSVLKRK